MSDVVYVNRGRFLRLNLTPRGAGDPDAVCSANQVLDEWAQEIAAWPNDADTALCLMADGSQAAVTIGEIKADLRSLA